MISMIAAVAKNRAIGFENKLIYWLPNDLKRFKQLTTGHTIIMGRKTFDSLPKGALPNRRNIILSTRLEEAPEGFEVVSSIKQALEAVKDEEEVFIMGGGMVYELFLPYTDRLYLTRIGKSFEADTYFPYINFEEWDLVDLEVIDDDPKVDYSYRFEVWERKQRNSKP